MLSKVLVGVVLTIRLVQISGCRDWPHPVRLLVPDAVKGAVKEEKPRKKKKLLNLMQILSFRDWPHPVRLLVPDVVKGAGGVPVLELRGPLRCLGGHILGLQAALIQTMSAQFRPCTWAADWCI